MEYLTLVGGNKDSVLFRSGEKSYYAFLEFFSAQVRNDNTRRAYGIATYEFMSWMEQNGVDCFQAVTAVHISKWVHENLRVKSTQSTKLKLAAIKALFDWLATKQVVAFSPAACVRGPRYSTAKGKTPVLSGVEARQLLDSIDASTAIGLRDRALIGLMLFSFARIGAALAMDVHDVFVQGRRLWVRLHEKGGKLHDMPCHHELECWLEEYIKLSFRDQPFEQPLFQSVSRSTDGFTGKRLLHANAYKMVRRRALAAGIGTSICNHSFRATGITSFLHNHGALEMAARMANHSSTKTTQLYDRRSDTILLSEVERIRL